MAEAEVGDDGFGDDPTVRQLEEEMAELLGHEAGLFIPSGVMGNQIALRLFTRPGDQVVVARRAHVVGYEFGAGARNAGVQFAPLDDAAGYLQPSDVAGALGTEGQPWPQPTMLWLEDTYMAAGGRVIPLDVLDRCIELAGSLPVHLDGARLFNAAVAQGVAPARLASRATSVMVCLSKGLGAPVGSVLLTSAEGRAAARIERKRLGGEMRQAGILAAAGRFALEHHVERLAQDHARAKVLAHALAERFPGSCDPATCDTNLVCAEVPDALARCAELRAAGVLATTLSPTTLRLTTHLDLDDRGLEQARVAIAALER